MTDYTAMDAVLKELERARQLHSWEGYDTLHMVAKMAGEAGEALREANKIHEGTGDINKLIDELVQAGGTVIRCLTNLKPSLEHLEPT